VRRTLSLLAACMLVVMACRPQLGPSSTPTPSSIAGNLVPSQPMTVGVHLPGAVGSLAAPILDIGITGTLAGANITLTTEPFAGGDQAFVGAGRTDAVDLFVADTGAALIANMAGGDLVLISSLQRSSSWRLMTLASGQVESLAQLAEGVIYIDGLHGDEMPLLNAMKVAGVSTEKLTLVFPEDPVVSFDPTQLIDGTVLAAFVRSFDGSVRLAQYVDPVTGVSAGESFYREIAIDDATDGLGIWASAASIESDDAKIAVAATLVALSDSFAKCRDDVAACATVVADSSVSDLSVEALAYGVNAINASLWPNPQGLFEIDRAALQVEIDMAFSVGLVASKGDAGSLIFDEILAMASQSWPAGVDRNGSAWVPLELVLP